MKAVFIFPFLVAVALSKAISSKKQYGGWENVVISDTIPGNPHAQTPKKFFPDDYPVTNKMFEGNYITIFDGNDSDILSKAIHSSDKAWFRNDILKQTLVFELYTDYHRLLIFHFKNNDIPPDLIRRMDLRSGLDPAGYNTKKKAFPAFIRKAKSIGEKYFRSNKGFRLGDSLEKVIKIYGKADKISEQNGISKYEWDYIGDTFYDPKKDKGKKIAQNSYGHQAILFFRNNKLTGLILHNDIP